MSVNVSSTVARNVRKSPERGFCCSCPTSESGGTLDTVVGPPPKETKETELMRRGELYRYRDPSGVSGTGVVALVVEFPPNDDGRQWVVVKWLGPNPCVTFWPGIAELLEVHGHLGASEIRWLDPDPFAPDEDPVLANTAAHPI
jgi:hypothetical protein